MILHGQGCRVAALVRRADRRCPSRISSPWLRSTCQDLPPEHLEKNRAAVEILKGDVPGTARGPGRLPEPGPHDARLRAGRARAPRSPGRRPRRGAPPLPGGARAVPAGQPAHARDPSDAPGPRERGARPRDRPGRPVPAGRRRRARRPGRHGGVRQLGLGRDAHPGRAGHRRDDPARARARAAGGGERPRGARPPGPGEHRGRPRARGADTARAHPSGLGGHRRADRARRDAARAARRAAPRAAVDPGDTRSSGGRSASRSSGATPRRSGQALADVRDELEGNLRLRLDAKPEHREPVSELRVVGAPDPAFHQARELLLRRDPRALDEFADLHYRRSTNTIAKEWYAYALTLFGQGTDIHDVIELLEAAIASDRFHEHRGWTARWNLACALRRLPSRADEALDVLLPVLDLDAHPAEAFELCLLWAIEQSRQDVLGDALPPRAPLRGAPPRGAPGRGGARERRRGRAVPRPLSPDQPDPPGPGPRLPRPPGAPALRGAGPADARVHRDLAGRGGCRVVPAARRGRPRGRCLQELGLRRHAQRGGRGPRRQLALPAPQLARHPAPAQRGSAKEGAAPARAPRLGPAARVPRGRAPGAPAELAGDELLGSRRAAVGRAARRRPWPTSAEAGRADDGRAPGGEAEPAATVTPRARRAPTAAGRGPETRPRAARPSR